jgi:hypothetical protein
LAGCAVDNRPSIAGHGPLAYQDKRGKPVRLPLFAVGVGCCVRYFLPSSSSARAVAA